MASISTELSLLKYILDKSSYLKLNPIIARAKVDREFHLLYQLVGSCYDSYPDLKDISTETLKTFFHYSYPKIKDAETYIGIIDRLDEFTVHPDLLNDVVVKFVEKQIANDIVSKLTPVLYESAWGVVPEIANDIDKFLQFKGLPEDEEIFVTHDIAAILEKQKMAPGLEWRLQGLRDDLGQLRGGTLGHVFASVDSGKTTFLVSEVAHFAKQLGEDEVILWFNNEERGAKIILRLYCAVLEVAEEALAGQEERAARAFKAKGGDKVKLIDRPIITIEDMTSIMRRYRARLVVVDQGDKVLFRGSDSYVNGTAKLKALYGKFRELAKDFDTDILTVGQAAATAEGKKWLTRVDMDESKVGKPGELDYAIGIGRSDNENEEELRFISLCKNKLHKGKHGKHTVRIDTERALYLNF